jgi:hypothetical protein
MLKWLVACSVVLLCLTHTMSFAPSLHRTPGLAVRASAAKSALFVKVALPILPSPSQLSQVARRTGALFAPVTKVSNTWKTVIALTAALMARFRGRLDKASIRLFNKMEAGWTNRGRGGPTSRTLEVYGFAVSYVIKFFRMRAKQSKVDKETYSTMQSEMAVVLRNKLLQLGPTFIKLGQLLSTRIDVLPKEYIKELVLLQDQVPPASPRGPLCTALLFLPNLHGI